MCFDRLMVLIVDSAKYKEDSIDELNRFINNEVLKFLIEDYLSEIEECEKILNDIRKREGGENYYVILEYRDRRYMGGLPSTE